MEQKNKSYKLYLEGFADEMRSAWLNSLLADAKESSEKKRHNVVDNWRREAWRPNCKTNNGINADNPCIVCEWLKIYNSRYYDEIGKKKLKKLTANRANLKQCPLISINDFINTIDKKETIKGEGEAEAGLRQLLDFTSLWLWFLDEVSGTIYFPEDADGISGLNSVAEAFVRNMVLPIGKGSNGYALRLGKGICMSDTFADPRGGVSIEDIVARNFSYIAVPIRENKSEQSKIIAYAALSYPLPHAWHEKVNICSKPRVTLTAVESHAAACFYQRFDIFLKDNVKKQIINFNEIRFDEHQTFESRIKALYSAIQDDKLSEKIRLATSLETNDDNKQNTGGADEEEKRWNNYLENLCVSNAKGTVVSNDALGINYASIWRVQSGAENKPIWLADYLNSNISNKHIENLIARSFSHGHLHGYDPANYYDGHDFVSLDNNNEKEDDPIKIRFIARTGVTADSESINAAKSFIKKQIEKRLDLIKLLAEEGLNIYKSAYSISRQNDEDKEEAVKIAHRKLFEGFADTVLSGLFSSSDKAKENIGSALKHWHSIGAIKKRALKKLDLLNTMPTNKTLISELTKIFGKGVVLQSVCIYINMEDVIGEGIYYPAYSEYHKENKKPWEFIGNKKEKIDRINIRVSPENFAERNFKSKDTYRVIDNLVNFGKVKKDGHLSFNSRSGSSDHISSSERWTSALTEHLGFNTFYKKECGDHDVFCALYVRHGSDKIKIDNDVQEMKDLSAFEKRLKGKINKPYFIFHMKKSAPYAFVQIPTIENKRDTSEEQVVKSLGPFIASEILPAKKLWKIKNLMKKAEPLLQWDVYKGTGEWKATTGFNTVTDTASESLKGLHQIGCHAVFAYPLIGNHITLGYLLFGRSLLHSENTDYSILEKQEQQVVKSLVNYAAHILSLKHQEELRIGALRDMAASQSHEMRNSLSALIGLGEINETGVETVRGRKLFNEKVGDMISDVNDIIAINNAIEAAHQRTPEMGLAQNVKIAEQLQEIWEQILGSEGFLNFRYNIHNLYNYDINYIEKDGELNKTGSLPKASIKMILKELLKNAIKYSDYCYIKKNEQASGISMKLLLQESSFTIVIGNGVSRDYFINKDNFALDRYEELKSVSYGFIKSPSAFSTKIGLNNIEDYILANYKGDINSLITITKPTEKSLYYSIQLKLPYEVNKI